MIANYEWWDELEKQSNWERKSNKEKRYSKTVKGCKKGKRWY